MSYALLGDVAFDLLNAPTAFDETHQANYAQHDVLAGKPKLQAMGVQLIELNLELQLHHQIGDVEQQYQALLRAKQQLKPLALVLGSGKLQGYFVITAISSRALFTDEQGLALARDVSVQLREFVGEIEEGVIGDAVQIGHQLPLASQVVKRDSVAFLDEKRAFFNRALQVYQRARQVIDVVRNTIQTVRQFAQDPASALALLPNLALQIGNVLGGLQDVVSGFAVFNHFGGYLQTVESFVHGVRKMASYFDAILAATRAVTVQTLDRWIVVSSESVQLASRIAQDVMESSIDMTAWIALRVDFDDEVV